ncbi:hypothetical protein [Streptomyces sp. NPDC059247]|uniref:hypothetical protein n=1 Tax=Streptomyces sp. NPDC059247 TaxID=3346790 RepID=UPI00368E2A11
MSRHEDREAAVRRLLDTPYPPVPGDLARRAAERGARRLRLALRVRRVLWVLAVAAVTVFALWASAARPWEAPPETTPSLEG